MKKKIAFFDFDGTITTRDTMLELIKFSKGKSSFYTGFLVLLPYLLAMKFKLLSNTRAKEKMLSYFFRNMPVAEFETICRRFSEQVIPGLVRPAARESLENYKKTGVTVVIVSASAKHWVHDWCIANNFQLISSVLETKDGRITGRLDGPNCHGKEKVNRISAIFNLEQYEDIHCYGDTGGDKPMLKLATKAYYKPFRD